MTPDLDTPSPFAMYEAVLIRRQLTDDEWQEQLQSRPSMGRALAAYEAASASTTATGEGGTGA